MTRADLEQDGPPIRLSQLAKILGMSRYKLMNDAERGDLRLVRIKCGQLRYRHVERDEALRYLDAVGYVWRQVG
jgi:hypothetical protein